MLITKDMLVQKGIAQNIVDAFAYDYLNGLDFAKLHTYFFFTDGVKSYREEDLARIFSYTGISIAKQPTGVIIKSNYVNGKFEDLSNGNPAVACTYNGVPHYVAFCKHNVPTNPAPGLPAYIFWHANGRMSEHVFYENGVVNDPFPGVPAVKFYSTDGKIECAQNWKDNTLTSFITYNPDGTIKHRM